MTMHKYGYGDGDLKVSIHEGGWCDTEGVHIELPHQCEAWVIGDADNAELMVKDLKKAIKEMRRRESL